MNGVPDQRILGFDVADADGEEEHREKYVFSFHIAKI